MRAIRFLLVLLIFGSSRDSAGQAVYGNIIGTATDPSGAAVPNAAVIIIDTDRGTTYQANTNASGNFEQTHLLAGHYQVKINAAGFTPFEASADVQIDAATRVDAQFVGKSPGRIPDRRQRPAVYVERLSAGWDGK